MLIQEGYERVAEGARRAVLAIGNFDGVHRGHRALLDLARDTAGRSVGTPAGVVLFDPHPRRYFAPASPLFELTPGPMKLDLLARYGADVAVVLAFDGAFAALSADAFVTKVLVEGLAVGHVIVGYDFHFGKGRAGTPETLVAAGAAHGFGVTVVPPVAAGGAVVSSSAVRSDLAEGDVARAAGRLGHWWRIAGTVTGGAKRGTGMGYPTANVALVEGCGLGHGIYAARIHVGGEVHDGATYLGTRPTFDDGKPVLETFLFDFDGDLYGHRIEVEFVARLRGDRRFSGMDELVRQMDQDVAAARRILGALHLHDPYAWPDRRR